MSTYALLSRCFISASSHCTIRPEFFPPLEWRLVLYAVLGKETAGLCDIMEEIL
jgi:hypothetical protein